MKFEPEELAANANPVVIQAIQEGQEQAEWRPLFRHPCHFGPDIFGGVMSNLIHNPNINSSWLFRADILHDAPEPQANSTLPIPIPSFRGFELRRCILRRLIPRNTRRDKPLDQTCLIFEAASSHSKDDSQTLVVYLPHVSAPSDMPFYHPVVRGIAFLHEWNPAKYCGFISISYLYFSDYDNSELKLSRTAFRLLEVIHKHGKGRLAGYQKRVLHDQVVPQARAQDTYHRLKLQYARGLIDGWAESTDPEKHVFEDLSIAAFLIELWADMYGKDLFPGFVDIGCGNGLLVYILNKEGYAGWGFDARSRKSWANYNTKLQTPFGEQDTLQQKVMLPPPVSREGLTDISDDLLDESLIHDGRFPKDTFIISNHADELTPWTPIVAAISQCPFMAIPCCSHNLTGDRFRAPAPKEKGKAESAYSSLVAWVAGIAKDCGWEVEQEVLRIPSTRNIALIGRRQSKQDTPVDFNAVVNKYGGAAGYWNNVAKLIAAARTTDEPDEHEHSNGA